MNIFDLPVLSSLLSAAANLFAGLGALTTPALAVVLVTLAVRALLIPVGVSMARAERGRRRIAPQLAALQKRWRGNPERLQRETLALYAAEKVSPFAGCLPALAQAPVLTLVYALFASPEIAGVPNALMQATFLGAPLGRHVSDAVAAFAVPDLTLLGVVVALVVIAWLARRAALRNAAALPATLPAPGQPAGLARALSFLPFLTVAAAFVVPLAAGLYLVVSGAWSLAERAVLRRLVVLAG